MNQIDRVYHTVSDLRVDLASANAKTDAALTRLERASRPALPSVQVGPVLLWCAAWLTGISLAGIGLGEVLRVLFPLHHH